MAPKALKAYFIWAFSFIDLHINNTEKNRKIRTQQQRTIQINITRRPKENVYGHPLYFVSCTTNYGGINPSCMSNISMVLSWHVTNTTQPFTISSPCFYCPVRNQQHMTTSNQPPEPHASSELSSPEPNSPSCCSPSSCLFCRHSPPSLAAQMGVRSLHPSRIRRCCLFVWTTV